MTSPFNWQGKPSIFTTGHWKSTNDFTGVNEERAANQSRLPPRPTYLVSGSVYLQQPKIHYGRKKNVNKQ